MSWKRTIRRAADHIAEYSGLLRACEMGMRSKLTVLMYHRVLEDADCAEYPFPSLIMPRSWFEAQLDYLSEYTCVLPVSEALGRLRDSSLGSKRLVCLTFDDGYVDNFEIAAPLLEARGLRGTFYITAGSVGARKRLWYDEAAALWSSLGPRKLYQRIEDETGTDMVRHSTRDAWIEWLKTIPNDRRERILARLEAQADESAAPCELMTRDQIRALTDRGHEIGAHTLSHPILTKMGPKERRAEIAGARELLQEWTGSEVAGFCYPNGDFDAEVIEDVQAAGYSHACTTIPGRNSASTDQFRLLRIDVTPNAVAASDGSFDTLGFRAEISLFRERLRRWMPSGRNSQ